MGLDPEILRTLGQKWLYELRGSYRQYNRVDLDMQLETPLDMQTDALETKKELEEEEDGVQYMRKTAWG